MAWHVLGEFLRSETCKGECNNRHPAAHEEVWRTAGGRQASRPCVLTGTIGGPAGLRGSAASWHDEGHYARDPTWAELDWFRGSGDMNAVRAWWPCLSNSMMQGLAALQATRAGFTAALARGAPLTTRRGCAVPSHAMQFMLRCYLDAFRVSHSCASRRWCPLSSCALPELCS